MTPEQQSLVQTSFKKIVPDAAEVAELFYKDLFARAPRLRGLFREDIGVQQHKFMAMLTMAVIGLDRWESIAPWMQEVGQRHDAYGVKPEDYEVMRESLMAVLAQRLGAEFTPAVRDAWLACYAAMSREMGGNAAKTA